MLTTNPFIEKSSSTILPGGPRYTYVLNNPLKYTDPSGYKKLDHYEIQELREEEQAYFRFWTSINEANDLNWVNSGGGGGGGSLTYDGMGNFYENGEWVPTCYAVDWVLKPNADFSTSDLGLISLIYALNTNNSMYSFTLYSNSPLGQDKYGSAHLLIEDHSNNTSSVRAIAFWQLSGNYYNELYWFDGLVAADPYQAADYVKFGALVTRAPSQDFSGFKGFAKFIFTGGEIDGWQYNLRGEVIGVSPRSGMAPIPGKPGSGLLNASQALKLLFKNGVKGNSIINVRNTLLNNGFTQSLTRNRAGYLFTNSLDEQVRIMNRNGTWDIRIMNQYGSYLDEFGNVGTPGSTHNLTLLPW